MKQPPLAYDFHGGNMRIWRDGELIGEFPRSYFPHIVLDLVKKMRDDLDQH